MNESDRILSCNLVKEKGDKVHSQANIIETGM